MRVIQCSGKHVCPACKGAGWIGKLLPRKCIRHIETTLCDEYSTPHTVSPVSTDGYVRIGERRQTDTEWLKWSTISHHNWIPSAKCTQCGHIHLGVTVCNSILEWYETGLYSYQARSCQCNHVPSVIMKDSTG